MSRKGIIAAVAGLVAAVVVAAAYPAGGTLLLGPASRTQELAFKGYYDGHQDTYLVTDVSNKTQAAALHVNYSAELARVLGAKCKKTPGDG